MLFTAPGVENHSGLELDWNTTDKAAMSNRFRRLTDLFTVGRALPLQDDGYLWVAALNSYQRDEAISDAQIARARLVMALREQGDERMKVESTFYEKGREYLISDLAFHRSQGKAGTALADMRADPEWKERMEILLGTNQEDTAKPLTPAEVDLLSSINTAVIAELERREGEDREYQRERLERLNDDELIEVWTEEWIDRRGAILATAEYQLTELWYAARYCNAVRDPDTDALDHAGCEGHAERIFETRIDVREAPNALIALIASALEELNVEGSDPKDSGRAGSSSDSSPTPSEPEESTPSTPRDDPSEPPGTSPTPSPTLSPS